MGVVGQDGGQVAVSESAGGCCLTERPVHRGGAVQPGASATASANADAALYLTKVDDARAYGCVPTDARGRVTALLEKMAVPLTNQINAG